MAEQRAAEQAPAIIGQGLVTSLGRGVAQNFARLLAGENGSRPLDRFPAADFDQRQGGQLAAADAAALHARWDEEDLALAMILEAAAEALGDAFGGAGADTGLVLGSNFGLAESLGAAWSERHDTGRIDPESFARQQDVLTRTAARAGIGGPRLHLSLSCASGAAALAVALAWLRAGRVRRVLALGYDELSEFCWCGLSNLRTISPDRLRPFDPERQGTLFGEGAAAMWLSADPGDAPRARAWLLGAATNNNAFHMTAPAKEGEGSRRVLAAALAEAGLSPAEIGFISAHATGTTANDLTESQALVRLCGGTPPPVIALKSGFGHLMGAAGLAEAVMSVCALQQGVLPPVQGMRRQDPACAVEVVAGNPRQGAWENALTNSAGIGGNNAAAVLGRRSRPRPPAPPPRPVVWRRTGWVLPGLAGSGESLPPLAVETLWAARAQLAGFSPKALLKSVKGYLDPAGAYTLGAAALCLGEGAAALAGLRSAVVGVSQYGAPRSAMQFYLAMLEKGHRLASPLIFPHGYANTAPNLVAIEFGLAGPHLVLTNAEDLAEGAWLAEDLLRRGLADDVLLLAAEAAGPEQLPDGWNVLEGALCFHLGTGAGRPWPGAAALAAAPGNRQGVVAAAWRRLAEVGHG